MSVELVGQRIADEIAAEIGGESGAEQRQGQTADDLIGAQGDRSGWRGSSAIAAPASSAPSDADPGVAGPDRDGETAERAHQHHAFDAEIEHAGALGKESRRGRRRGSRCRPGSPPRAPSQEGDRPDVIHAAATRLPRSGDGSTRDADPNPVAGQRSRRRAGRRGSTPCSIGATDRGRPIEVCS